MSGAPFNTLTIEITVIGDVYGTKNGYPLPSLSRLREEAVAALHRDLAARLPWWCNHRVRVLPEVGE